MDVLLPFCYFGNVEFYSHLFQHQCYIELHENMPKRTERNRCLIKTSQGIQKLIVPLKRGTHSGPFLEVELSDAEDWKGNHLKSLVSNYNSSPFFSYFEMEIRAFYSQEYPNLFALNQAAHQLIGQLLNQSLHLEFTKSYQKDFEPGLDRRADFKSSQFEARFLCPEYPQTFEEKLPYHPHLSILDLLFNEGPAAITYLKNNPFKHGNS